MIKYRPHRGGLDEAMKEYKEFTDIAEMLKYIEQTHEGKLTTHNIVIDESHGEDSRIGWKSSRYVCTTRYGNEKYSVPQCIGMCDLGELG